MAPLMLDTLEIHNFRLFQHLRIPRLSRVNLIVGTNNIGKTSLLEVLWLYARRGVPAVLWEQLAAREESNRPSAFSDTGYTIQAINNIFSGRGDAQESNRTVTVGPAGRPDDTLSISVEMHDKPPSMPGDAPVPTLYYVIRLGHAPKLSVELIPGITDIASLPSTPDIPHAYVSANGMPSSYISGLWDQIALTDLEERVINALKIILPEVERVNLISDPKIGPQRIPTIRLRGSERRVPLRSYGGGLNKLFGAALALVNSQGGILIVDEIENGLHYSIQPDMWRLIFQVAVELNVQVFATTHSHDCVQAFQQIAREQPEEGRLIRLGRKKGRVVVTLFDEEELEIAVEQHVEVR